MAPDQGLLEELPLPHGHGGVKPAAGLCSDQLIPMAAGSPLGCPGSAIPPPRLLALDPFPWDACI